jgi:hypothetical protein
MSYLRAYISKPQSDFVYVAERSPKGNRKLTCNRTGKVRSSLGIFPKRASHVGWQGL